MQGVKLPLDSSIFNGKFGTVLDSGTTYAYLPDRAFNAFKDAVSDLHISVSEDLQLVLRCSDGKLWWQVHQQLGALQQVDGPDPNYPDICYAGAGT